MTLWYACYILGMCLKIHYFIHYETQERIFSFSNVLQISVWSGSCASLTCVTGSDDVCDLKSSVSFSTTVGTTYSIFVHGYSADTGVYELSVSGTGLSPAPTPYPTRAPDSPTCLLGSVREGFEKMINGIWG